MLNIFRSFNPYAVFVLFLVAIVFKLAFLVHPVMPYRIAESPYLWLKLADFMESALGHSAFLLTFFAIVNLFGQAIYLNRIASTHHLYPKASYLPAMGYVLLTSLFKDWNYLSATLVSNWLLLAMLSGMLQLYAAPDARKQIFNIGCCISLAAMLVFPNIAFILLLLLALAVLRPFKISEWMVGLLGLLTPLYFLAGILFLTDNLHLLPKMAAIGFRLPDRLARPEIVIAAFSVIALLMTTGVYYLNTFMSRMLIQNKKWWYVVIGSFFVSLIAGTFTIAKGYNQWLGVLVPVTFIVTNTWFEERHKWLPRVFIYVLMAVIIFVQWFPIG